MASIVWSNVTDLASGHSAVSANMQTAILAHVNTALDTAIFNDGESDPRLFLCRVYLAAHFGEGALPASGGGAAGPITGRTQGDMSISYGFSSFGTASDFDTTSFGRQYLSLIQGTPARGGLLL
jgi:hypothetical protein